MQGQATLYEKFETVLAHMGIEIQLDNDSQPYGDDTGFATNSQAQRDSNVHNSSTSPHERLDARPRRNSESTLWHIGTSPAEHLPRSRSQSSFFHPEQPQSFVPLFVEQGVQTEPDLQDESPAVPSVLDADHPIGAWLSKTVPGAQPPSSNKFSESSGSHRHRQAIHRNAEPRRPPTQISQYDSDGFLIGGQATTVSNSSDLYDPPSSEHEYQEEFYEDEFTDDQQEKKHRIAEQLNSVSESTTNLEIKATFFRSQRCSAYAANVLINWRHQARLLHAKNHDMNAIAAHHDLRIVFQQSLHMFRLTYQTLVSEKRVEKDYDTLAEMVTQKRIQYVLGRSLSYWQGETRDGIYRTEAARLHLMAARIFRKWHDLSLINETKVRRHVLLKFIGVWRKQLGEHIFVKEKEPAVRQLGLKKFFGIWRQKQNKQTELAEHTVQVYTANLVRAKYWAWYWEYCARHAPYYCDSKLLPRMLTRWVNVNRRRVIQEETASQHRDHVLRRSILRKLCQKYRELLEQERIASAKYTSKTQMKSLMMWSSESIFLPVRFQVQNMVATRIKRHAFSQWKSRAQQELRATAVDRHNIMRETWTRWTDLIRIRHFQVWTNQRTITQAMYKWTLAERTNFLHRSIDKNLLRLCFDKLQESIALKNAIVAHDIAICIDFRDGMVKRRAFTQLKNVYKARKEHEVQALQIYAPRVVDNALIKWSARVKYVQEIDRWARDGNYYFLAMRTLKRWKAATQESRKERRRQAFAQIRRQAKLKLASSVLATWREKARLEAAASKVIRQKNANLALKSISSWRLATNAIRVSIQVADSALTRKTMAIATIAFSQWHSQQRSVITLENLHYQTTIAHHFSKWRGKTSSLQDLHAESTAVNEDRLASFALKRWRVATLQLKGTQAGRLFVAKGQFEASQKRTLRRILTYWYQRTPISSKPQNHIQLRSEVSGSTTIHAQGSSQKTTSSALSFSETARAENWSEFGEGEDGEIDVEEWAREFSSNDREDNITHELESMVGTPIPGYLATPSRKMNRRVGVVSARATTTPAQGLSTPFERLLRQQYAGIGSGSVANFRRTQGFGGGRGSAGGFADLGKSV